MTAHDRIISELLHALDCIQREAAKPEASRHYISGVVEQAVENWKARCERNSDGYLVVKEAVR